MASRRGFGPGAVVIELGYSPFSRPVRAAAKLADRTEDECESLFLEKENATGPYSHCYWRVG